MKKILYNQHTHLLEENQYVYGLQDVPSPQLFREIFPYDMVPKVTYNHRHVPINMPEEIFISDTTFRDGQQSRTPYTVEQVVAIYKMLHRLSGPNGIIRQSEFFVYSQRDRDAIEKCISGNNDLDPRDQRGLRPCKKHGHSGNRHSCQLFRLPYFQ